MSFTLLSVVLLLNLAFRSLVVVSVCDKYLVKQTYLGAHNAYHQITTAETASTEDVGDVYIPIFLYDNKQSIYELLEYGVRGIEIDIYPKDSYTNFPASFSVEHVNIIDTKSSCDTLTTCLEEVNDFLVACDSSSDSGTVGPILVRIEAKLFSNSLYSTDDLVEIESIVKTTLGSKYLFTPKDFGAKAKQTHWPDWGNICLKKMKNKVIVGVSDSIIDTLYPSASTVSTNKNADSMERQCPMFALCNTASDSRYCTINSEIEDSDDDYLYSTSISNLNGGLFIQPNELSLVDNFIINYETEKVTISETLYNVALAELQACEPNLSAALAEAYFGLGIDFTLPLKTWNAFEYIAFVDAYVGNSDTFANLAENLVASFYLNGRSDVNDPSITLLFTTEVSSVITALATILDGCSYGTIEGHSIFDPIVWFVLEYVFDNFGFNEILPNVNVSAIETRVCDAYVSGYQYVFGDYLFTDGTNTEYTAFTMEDTLNAGGSGCVSSTQTFNFRNQ